MAKVKEKLTHRIRVRCSEFEKNRLQMLADMYAGGNLSLWIIYAAMNVERKHLKTDSLDESRRHKKGIRNASR